MSFWVVFPLLFVGWLAFLMVFAVAVGRLLDRQGRGYAPRCALGLHRMCPGLRSVLAGWSWVECTCRCHGMEPVANSVNEGEAAA